MADHRHHQMFLVSIFCKEPDTNISPLYKKIHTLGYASDRLTVSRTTNRLMLLGSPPDMVHGEMPHSACRLHIQMYDFKCSKTDNVVYYTALFLKNQVFIYNLINNIFTK